LIARTANSLALMGKRCRAAIQRKYVMIWSKLKKTIDSLMADSVQQHLQVYLTRYGPGESYFMNRAWVTWDGEEINTFSTVKYYRTQKLLAAQLSGNPGVSIDYNYFKLVDRKYIDQAGKILENRGLYPCESFLAALETYTSLSIDDALHSSDVLIRGWSMFDRRLGKRRLRAMHFKRLDRHFGQPWYRLRCGAEGISVHEVRKKG
jgi:hypothetical protein